MPRAAAVVAGAREVTLRTVDGLALGAWLVEAGEPDRSVAVLVANGNAGNRSLRAPSARALASAGLAVLLFDYRGYGGNPGPPSVPGTYRAMMRRREWPSPYVQAVSRPGNFVVLVGSHGNSWLERSPTAIDAKAVAAPARPELEASIDPPLWQYF